MGEGWQFSIEALVDPQSLPRIIGYFAQRSIIPTAITMRADDAGMMIAVSCADLPEDQANIIAAKLRQVVVVLDVRLEARALFPA